MKYEIVRLRYAMLRGSESQDSNCRMAGHA